MTGLQVDQMTDMQVIEYVRGVVEASGPNCYLPWPVVARLETISSFFGTEVWPTRDALRTWSLKLSAARKLLGLAEQALLDTMTKKLEAP